MRNNVVIEIEVDEKNHVFRKLDLYNTETISLEWRSNLLSDIDKITCSSSYTISVPHTVNNDLVLDLAKVPSHLSGTTYKRIKCHVYVNGFNMTGVALCYITDSDKDSYSLVITFGLMQNLNNWLTNKPSLRDLNPYNTKIGGSSMIEYIDWTANAGVTIWQNDFPSKYNNTIRSMFYGSYDCGVVDTQLCNIHPWVSLREIWERIMAENSISISVPYTVLNAMEDIGLLLTSNNTKNYTTQNKTIYSGAMQQIGWIQDVEQYFTLRFNESDFYHNVTPRLTDIAFSPTRYTTPATWNEFGFLHAGEGNITIAHGTYQRIYVSGLQEWEQGVPAILNGTTTYYDYFANHEEGDMIMYYPNSNGTYSEVSAQRNTGSPLVYFDIPTINADGSRPIIGSLVFRFYYYVNNKQIQFNHAGILVNWSSSYTGATASIPFTCTYQTTTNAYNPSNGVFNLVENLPDISQIDFIKAVCHIFGLFCIINTNNNLELVSFSKLKENIDDSVVYDWSHRLVNTDKPSPYKTGFTLNGFARQNSFGYRPDDKDMAQHNSIGYLYVDNETLEKEKKLIEFPFAATRVSGFNETCLIQQYIYTGDNEVKFSELEYRLLQVEFDDSQGRINPKLSFPAWMEASALLNSNYSEYQNAIRKPRVITERIVLNEYELKTIDFAKPVYLRKYGRYFAIMSARWSSNTKTSEVKLLLL